MRLVALSTVLFCTTLAVAQEEVLQFEQANQSYRNGDYKKAAQLYEKILDNGYESAALYYDLGNCYFKLENIPATILSYERARRLAPHDEDISYNLRLANLRVVDKIDALPRLFFVDWGTALMNMFSSDGWALVEIVSLWCAMLCGVTFFLFRSVVIQRFTFFLGLLSMLVCIAAVTGIVQQRHHERDERAAVVFSPSVSVKSAPDSQSTDLFVIHEGVTVDLMDAVGGWKKIRLADGKIGWLSTESIQII